MNKDAVITVRLPSAIKAALQQEADADMRTLASLAGKILVDHVQQRGVAATAAPKPTRKSKGK